MSHARRFAVSLILGLVLSLDLTAAVQQGGTPAQPSNPNTTVAGELLIEPATLINLGFEWFIQGDANRRAPDLGAIEAGAPAPTYGPRR